jgi:hypothetical protein
MSEPLFFFACPRLSSASLPAAFFAHADFLQKKRHCPRLREGAAPRVKAARPIRRAPRNAQDTRGISKTDDASVRSCVGGPTIFAGLRMADLSGQYLLWVES